MSEESNSKTALHEIVQNDWIVEITFTIQTPHNNGRSCLQTQLVLVPYGTSRKDVPICVVSAIQDIALTSVTMAQISLPDFKEGRGESSSDYGAIVVSPGDWGAKEIVDWLREKFSRIVV